MNHTNARVYCTKSYAAAETSKLCVFFKFFFVTARRNFPESSKEELEIFFYFLSILLINLNLNANAT